MRILFLGDMVARTGREAVFDRLPGLIEQGKIDFTIVNGENAAGGFGITIDIANATFDAGADVVTLGNHSFDQRQILAQIDGEDRLLRPLNYPAGTPGRGVGMFEGRNGHRVLVSNIMGTAFMHPVLEDPFQAAERAVDGAEAADAVVIDFHAEATSEKQCMGHFLDGRASLVVGTHTHVPTADHQILPHGTGYLSDAGMCGDYDSSLGMDKEEPLNRFLTKVPRGRYEPASGPATVCGVCVEVGPDRLATRIAPLRVGGRLEEVIPLWW